VAGNGFGWKHLRDERDDWYPPREVRCEIYDGAGDWMSEYVMSRVALGVQQMTFRIPIVLCGVADPMRHPLFAEMVDTIRQVDAHTPIWVETVGMTLAGDAETRTPERVFVHVANRLAELQYAGCNVIVFRRDPRTEYIWQCVSARAGELSELTQVRVTRDYPKAALRDHSASEICLWDPPPMVAAFHRLEQRCMQPHTSMTVRWDGTVPLCQEDDQVQVYMGNVLSSMLDDIWFSPWYKAARARGWAGLRDLGPCRGCLRQTDRRTWLNHHALASLNPADEESERQIRRRIELAPR
jgi:Iron-sulfur cluster-binding domain